MKSIDLKPFSQNIGLDVEALGIMIIAQKYHDSLEAEGEIYRLLERIYGIVEQASTDEDLIRIVHGLHKFIVSLNIYSERKEKQIVERLRISLNPAREILETASAAILKDLHNQGGGDMGHLMENLEHYHGLFKECVEDNEPIYDDFSILKMSVMQHWLL